MKGYYLMALLACGEKAQDTGSIENNEPSTEQQDTDTQIVNVGTITGCLDDSDIDVEWSVTTAEWFCVQVGPVGGNSNFSLSVEVDGDSLELIDDVYDLPPEGSMDMPSTWGQVYKATAAGEATVRVLITTLGIEDTGEYFSLSFTVADPE